MKNFALITSVFLATAVMGCSSSSSSTPAGPVIDSLDVPAMSSSMMLQGQTGQGIVVTLTAHDDSAGITALHIVITGLTADDALMIPGSPTMLSGQQIQFVVPNTAAGVQQIPSGPHQVSFHLTDANNQNSAVVTKTVTVP